jgi:hypothetical protein
LLAGCATVLAGQAALIWFYVSAITQDIHILTANQAETMRALLAVKTQQPASNATLDTVLHELQNLSAIREELHALNEKASRAADVTPPRTSGSQREGSIPSIVPWPCTGRERPSLRR